MICLFVCFCVCAQDSFFFSQEKKYEKKNSIKQHKCYFDATIPFFLDTPKYNYKEVDYIDGLSCEISNM